MRVTELPAKFQMALPVLQKIQQAGFEAYFVGGSVRDTLLGLPIHDIDIATSAYPAEIKQIFNKTVDTGIEHGTVMVLHQGQGYEITTFRTESTYQDYRRPDKVEFVRSLSEDLKRRDLTINAFAMALDGEIIDLFDGLTDLQKGLIKAVGSPQERFSEDALRMMRALRFASQLDFQIETQTLQAIKQNAPLLEKIAIERIHVEWIKLLQGKAPLEGLKAFLATEMYRYCPFLATKAQGLQKMLNLQPFSCQDEPQAWSYMSFCLGLDKVGVNQLLKAWKSSNETLKMTNQVLAFVDGLQNDTLNPRLFFESGKEAIIAANQIAQRAGFGKVEEKLLQQYEALPIKDKREICLNGKDLIQLGYQPGPQLGKILSEIEQLLLVGKISNTKQALQAYAKQQLTKE